MAGPRVTAVETPGEAQTALAQMIHNGHLATWLVRTAGTALVWSVAPVFVFGFLAVWSDEPALWGLGSFVGLVAFLVYLTNAVAPFPTKEVLDLLDDRPDDDA